MVLTESISRDRIAKIAPYNLMIIREVVVKSLKIIAVRKELF